VYEWNRTEAEYPAEKTIGELFEEQAAKTPEAVAVVFEDRRLNYRELNWQANRLARYLYEQYGIGPDDLVALCLDRSEYMLIAILGVLKAGGAYVPIAPDYPDERTRYILKDTGAKVVLTNEGRCERLVALAGEGQEIEGIEAVLFREGQERIDGANPPRRAGPWNLAYVIYTSGTTGQPKGVMIEHQGVVNLTVHQGKEFGLYQQKEKKKCLWYANYVFDAHVSELFTAIGNGHTLYIATEEQRMDPELLVAYIKRNNIEIATIPPALLDRETIFPLETIIVAGEVSSKKIMDAYRESGVHVINAYGPTETSVCASLHHYEDGDSCAAIGKPLANTTLYIVDENRNPLPVGAVGELYIGGDGVARGYLNLPELTAERFIQNPFQRAEEKERGRNGILYRTGDLARYRADGSIEYIGRNDFQVKIRGYRIEPGEIENRLLEYEGIKQAAVVVKEQRGGKHLIAYYVSEFGVDNTAIRTRLEELLPDYMVPEAYVRLDKLPLTANGKLDRQALPEPELGEAEEYVGPANKREEELCAIFGEVLGIEPAKISVTGNFFRLGGTSILAIKLANRIQSDVGALIRVADIMALKTARKIAQSSLQNRESGSGIEPAVFGSEEEQALSFEQGRLWFLQNYEGGNTVYNIPIALRIREGIHTKYLKQAIEDVVKRHEVLRSVIKINRKGEAYQAAIDEKERPFRIAEKTADNRDALRMEITKEMNHIFDLKNEYPIRATVYTEGNNRYLAAVIHHIAFDGWSNDIFFEEIAHLCRYYESEGKEPYPLKKLKIQYKDYALWQRSYLEGESFSRKLAYWKKNLAGCETLSLAADKARPMHTQYEGDDVEFEFDKATSMKIKEIAAGLDVSPYTALLAAYYLLLLTYSNQKDIVIGTFMANRQYPETNGLIGFFVNTIALRQKIDTEQEIAAFIKAVGENVIRAQENQEAPFEKLVEEMKIERDTSRSPLFQALFAMESFGEKNGEIRGVFEDPGVVSHENKTAKFDISLVMKDTGAAGMKGVFNYAVSVFDRKTIESYVASYKTIVGQIIEHINTGGIKIKNIRALEKETYEQILYKWNQTWRPYPKDKIIPRLFEEQALKTPGNTALVFEDKRLSYWELHEEANRLGNYLQREYHIQPDDIVALCLDPGEQMVIAILAVLKAGGAYTPIMPDYPPERINYMVEDTGAKVILANEAHGEKLRLLPGKGTAIELLDSKTFMKKMRSEESVTPVVTTTPDNLAYTIYTSGTTGRPKGVMIEHRGVPNLTSSLHSLYGFSETGEAALLFANYGFDPSVEQMFLALLNGHTLVVPKDKLWMDESAFIGYLNREKVTHIQMTPSLLQQMNLQDIDSLKRVVVVGEAVTDKLVEDMKDKKFSFINSYGPTEITVIATVSADGKSRHIGRPIANTTCYILDEDLQPRPVGAVGELYIGGVGVARGYLNQKELTRERFIPNPFQTDAQKRENLNGVIYKTGDLARYLPDGTIDYIGRNDFQVKIRGLRIELGEIESRLLLYPGLRQAAVVAKERPLSSGQIESASIYLAAYYVSDQKLDEQSLRAFLEETLLEHMMPSVFVHLDKLPLTTNGKLDRRALPEPELTDQEEYAEPSNDIEKKLCALYGEILGLAAETVSAQADFFKLGGDSIRCIRLVNLIHRQLQCPIKIKDIFAFRTVRKLYENLFVRGIGKRFIRNEQGLPEGECPLLPAQRYFFSNMNAGKAPLEEYHAYVTSYFLEIEDIDEAAFRESLAKLVEYHDAFRLRFRKVADDSVQQYYGGMPEVEVDSHDLGGIEADERRIETERIVSEWTGKIDIFSGPLFIFGRIAGVKERITGVYLMAHHLITDGVSWRILGYDFIAIYRYLKEHTDNLKETSVVSILGPKGTSCRQWINALAEYGRSEEKNRVYWEDVLKAARESNIQMSALSTQKTRSYVFWASEDLTAKILRISHQGLEIRIDDLLLSALDMTLNAITGIASPCVLMETHGRQEIADDVDVSRTMGWFASSYPVRLPPFNNSIKELVFSMKEMLRKVPNEGIGANALWINQDSMGAGMPKIYFNYQGEYESGLDGAVEIKEAENQEAADINGFDLSVSMHVSNRRFTFTILSKLKDDRMSNFSRILTDSLEAVAAEMRFPNNSN
jgi:amino acid adenylation domain-containing protein